MIIQPLFEPIRVSPLEMCRALLADRGIPHSMLLEDNALEFVLSLAERERACSLVADGPGRVVLDIALEAALPPEQAQEFFAVLSRTGSCVTRDGGGEFYCNTPVFLPSDPESAEEVLNNVIRHAEAHLGYSDIACEFAKQGHSADWIIAKLELMSWGEAQARIQ